MICVDNGSIDGSASAVREQFPDVDADRERRATSASRAATTSASGAALERGADWVLLVNNDATVAPDAIARARRRGAAHRPRAGILGGKVLFADPPDRVWFAGQRFNAALGYSGRPRGYRQAATGRGTPTVEPVDRAVGACMAVSRPRDRGGRAARRGAVRLRRGRRLVAARPRGRVRGAARAAARAPGTASPASTGGEARVDARRSTTACATRSSLRAPPAAAAGAARAAPGDRRRDVRARERLPAMRAAALLRAVLDGARDARRGRLGQRSTRS